MCGIAGEYLTVSDPRGSRGIERVNSSLFRRGPDGSGSFNINTLTLGHRRLKIFDLSDRGAQPMVDHTLGLAIVYNGEIYNFRELRNELRRLGYEFTSESDTEVLLKCFHHWGKECVQRLSGMFAFAIWERDSAELVLCRDRMGIKPLYYAVTSEGFKFASTLTALLEFEGIDTSIDPVALQHYLTFHAVPEPRTILNGVKKLQPGTIMSIYADGTSRSQTYWDFKLDERRTDFERSEEDWMTATQEALSIATERQLSADVPVGVLLSGGLDSSLLVGLARRILDQDIETFSVGFETVGAEKGDEFEYSDIVAKRFETRHHKLFISNRELVDSLDDCVAAMSEPMTSHDNIGFYLLSQEVAKHVKVVLSGQGADEIFAGYFWFQTLPLLESNPVSIAKLIHDKVSDRSMFEYRNAVRPRYHVEDTCIPFLKDLCERNGSSNSIDNLLAYESTFALTNGPLGRVDNMTMASSLEARVPFLDEVVVDLALSMPLLYKLRGGGKYVLKQIGRRLLPIEVVDRAKGYFPVPALKHIQGETLKKIRDVLSTRTARQRGIFDRAYISELIKNPGNHLTHSGASKLWQVGLLEYWLQSRGL